MRIATCSYNDQVHLAIVQEDSVFFPATHPQWPDDISTMLQLIDAGEQSLQDLQKLIVTARHSEWLPLADVELLSPIPRPRQNVMCLGWNYIEHVEETSGKAIEAPKLPKYPIVFTKAASSMNGPFADIPVDLEVSNKMDWEVELAVIIGKTGQKISKKDALDHVFGYSVINDVSAREIQKRHKQFFVGKSFTGACPMGPWIVTKDEIADPQNLNIKSWVNNDLKQDSNTQFQIFDIASVIETLSRGMTLEAGDIIATGTPSGVGYVRTPPEYLMPGDVVDCEVEGIGRISNPIVAK